MEKDSWRKIIMQTRTHSWKEINVFHPKLLLWGVQTPLGTEQPPVGWASLSEKRRHVSPGHRSRICRAHHGLLLHQAPPGELLQVDFQESLTNTEERWMCCGTLPSTLQHPMSFSAIPYPAMLMEISPFLKSLPKRCSTALPGVWPEASPLHELLSRESKPRTGTGRDKHKETQQEKKSEEQKWNLMAEQNSLLPWKRTGNVTVKPLIW